MIGRSASIFRVNEIIVYPDTPDESKFIKLVLRYMETPQYLRKYLYDKLSELKYVGSLPALRTPHHPIGDFSQVNVGDFREGVILDITKRRKIVDIGVKTPLILEGKCPPKNSRVTVKITKKQPVRKGIVVSKKQIVDDGGFDVHELKSKLENLLLSKQYDVKIGTSRHGKPINLIASKLQENLIKNKNIIIVFGSPRKGIKEIMHINQDRTSSYFDYYLNTIPRQGTATVRTEEAIHSTLTLLNFLRNSANIKS
jgi:predicted SPOUT superfamily RNA methylase MTH1